MMRQLSANTIHPSTLVAVTVALILTAAPGAAGGESRLPQVDGEPVLASINGEPILLEEFYRELAARHATVDSPDGPVARQDPSTVLDELIDTRLILQEARNIGLHELPEIAQTLGVFRRDTLRDVLLLKTVGVITEPDPETVERLYREAVGRVTVIALFFNDEQEARALRAAVDAGGDFEALAAEAVAAGKATGGERSPEVKVDTLLPAIREVLFQLEPGRVSRPLEAGDGFALVQLIERDVPDKPGERARVEKDALKQKQLAAVMRHTDELKRRYTHVDQDVLDSIDYQANGLEPYLEDMRVVAEVEGGEDLTVAVLTQRVRGKFFHGAEAPVEKGKADRQKLLMLEDVLRRRAVLAEAARLELDKSPEYLERVSGFENRVLFGTFVQKAIDPGLQIEEADLQAYLDDHADEFSTPVLVRLESLAFTEREAAERALELLRRGSDPQWVRDNAEGLIDPEQDDSLLEFPPRLVVVDTLPDGVRETVADARAGEYRLYPEPDAWTYVLHVRDRAESRTASLDAVRGSVREGVVMEKRREAVDEWAAQLRAASEIEIYATGDALRDVLGLAAVASE